MKLCSFISAKYYDYVYMAIYVLYVTQVVACFIHEDIYLYSLSDKEQDATKSEKIKMAGTVIVFTEFILLAIFALDVILHAIGYGILYCSELVHALDFVLIAMNIIMLVAMTKLEFYDQVRVRGLLRIIRTVVVFR